MGALALNFAVMAPPIALPPAQPVMKGLRKRVWLLLYTEGGTWTGAEIAARFGMPPRKLYSMLGEMVRDKFLTRKRVTTMDGDELTKFGVSGGCGIPRGVALEEIEELLRLAVGKRA